MLRIQPGVTRQASRSLLLSKRGDHRLSEGSGFCAKCISAQRPAVTTACPSYMGETGVCVREKIDTQAWLS